uniref:7TM_GPCR_Srx domain-containing protein n=1 Tax=Caenorhabditis tropicalis TaxID=1561998 RepID=A0A1I7T6E0_9PELO
MLEEINAGIAAFVSLIANFLLIYLTSKVKTYSDTTIMYISEVKSLYIVKGGIDIPRVIGAHFLNLFLVFVVTSCTGPTIQYLQVSYLLSNPALKNHLLLRTFIGSIPIIVAVPTFFLIYIGYTPSAYEMDISESLIHEITGHEDSSFLIASEEKIMMAETGTFEYDVSARVCTFFMFTAMILSVIVVAACFSHMQKKMNQKKSINSQQSVKSQKQLNLLLMVQNVRDTLLNRSRKNTPTTGITFTSSLAFQAKNSTSNIRK